MLKKLPKSLKKFIRREKARIRREVLDIKKQKELINQLYQRLVKSSKTSSTGPFKEKPIIAEQVEVALSGKNNENKRNL